MHPMTNPTMHLPGYDFISVSMRPEDNHSIVRGCQFRANDNGGFELNVGTPDIQIWRPCGEPVAIPAHVKLNYAVLDGNGAWPV